MAGNLSDFKEHLKKIAEAVQAKLPDIAITLTVSAKALAEREIKETGFKKQYSPSVYPAWFLHGKALNAQGTQFLADRGVNPVSGEQGEAKKRRKKKGETESGGVHSIFTNWKEFREVQGLQGNHVDLSYSNKMWANMQPIRVEQSGRIYRALLGATNIEAQQKMNYNFARYGDFIGIALQGDEKKKQLTDVVNAEVIQILDQFK